jgi:EAL domain-containing protein (putative c-di-GMP-specific phosphodiesterase class I)
VGAEALTRWQHPRLGLVPPSEFIPLAEQTGLIEAIGRWVLSAACLQNRVWRYAGLPDLPIAVNVSPRQFWHSGFRAAVESTLRETQLQAGQLELEITESCLLRDLESTRAILGSLREIGVRVSIDDFGTGYSSFSVLRQLPLDTLKIDRSFVAEATSDPGGALIASAILNLGSSLGLRVVAEGVETDEQREYLLEHECRWMQGFHFSAPMPASVFTQLLRSGAALPIAKRSRD